MTKLKILNSKEKKRITNMIYEQFGARINNFAFVTNEKKGVIKVYIISKDFSKIINNINKLNINSIGLYFGEIKRDKIRLTIEGSQIVGKDAKKNIVEINKNEIVKWLSGENIEKKCNPIGYIIIKYKDNFCGCGFNNGKEIINYIPKSRRVKLL